MREEGTAEEAGGRRGWKPAEKGPRAPVVRRRTHLSVVLGITFCVIGGAIMTSALVLSWSIGASAEQSAWDLLERGGVFALAILVPICGALSAVSASLDVLAEKGWKRMKGPSALGSLALALMAIIALAVVILGINGDIEEGSATTFGPALFMSVFGGVLAVSGGMILAIDYLEARARRGRFVASGGSEELRRALRPASKDRKAPPRELAPLEVTALEARREAPPPRATGLECPNCYSPVQPNWRICPICGEELL